MDFYKTPKGDAEEGFVFKDTGHRPIILIHPARGNIARELQKSFDVFAHRLIPPDAGYLVQRDSWEQVQNGLEEGVIRAMQGR
jgi:hypothetical protein